MITQALQLLLVEDNPGDAALVQEGLRPAAPDWALHHVETLAAALAFLQQQGVDVVLLDLGLPDSQGLAAVDMIMSRYPAQAVVVLGDSDDIGMSVKAVQQGAQDYLVKGSATSAGMVRAIMYGLERARNRQARRFHQRVVQLLNGSDHLHAMLEGFVDEAMALTGCAAAGIRLLDGLGNIPFVHSKGFPEGFYERECDLHVKRDTCLCIDTVTGRCELAPQLHTKRGSLICDDLRALVDALPAAQRPLLRTGCLDAGFRTELLIPIRAGDRLTGLVQLADPAVRKLPSAWVEILEDTALQLGLAVARVQATGELRANETKLTHLNAVLNAIRKVNALITQQQDVQTLLEGVCRALVESRGWQAAWIVKFDQDGKPRNWAEQGLGETFAALQQRFGPDDPPACWRHTEEHQGVLSVDDTAQVCGDCPVAASFPGSGAMAARLGTGKGSSAQGLLCVSVPAGFAITAEERELFAEVAGDLGFALHTQQLERDSAEAQKRLLLEMRRSHQITELAPVVIIALDLQGRLEWINKAGCELVGLSEPDILGTHAFETFVVPRELVHVLGDFAAGMSGDFERIRRYECTVQTGDGREVLMAWHNALRLSADGHIEGLLCAGEDISERKKVQARLAQSDRMATVGMLAAGVAHEINNPLTYILYNLEEVTERVPDLVHAVVQMRRLLVDKLGEDKASQALGPLEAVISQDALSELRECLDDASTGAERVRDIVRDLKVFSRVEDDTRSLIDLRAPVETAVSMAYNEIKYRARLVKELPSLPMVLANDGRLAQVFVNLLINAAQAIPEGDAANQQITVRAHHHDGVIEVSISDTGKGINPEVLPMIFEPFFTTKPAGVGSGLGLSICRNIIQGLGGEISAHSEPGQGTTFTVVLPVADATVVQPVIEPAPEKQVPAPAGRVLVVDDDPLLRSLVNRLLGSRHSVVLAASGAEAIALLEQDSAYNAVVCDVMMPEVTGVDVFRHVQQQHPELVPRFVFMTGGIFTPTTREFLMLNPRPTLEKPFEPRVLRELVAEILEQQQAGV